MELLLMLAGHANGNNFGVSRRIAFPRYGIRALSDDRSIANHQCAERASSHFHVLDRKLNCASEP
jgi:hypothetical protein